MCIVWILVPLGVGLLLVGFAIGRCWTLLWRSEGMGFPATLEPKDHLITHGLYSYVRHPHNLMIVLESIGISFISLSLFYLSVLSTLSFLSFLFFAFLPLLVYLITLKEEGKLIERFGEEYLEYRRRAPMFIPRKQFWSTCLRSIRGNHRRPR